MHDCADPVDKGTPQVGERHHIGIYIGKAMDALKRHNQSTLKPEL
jgi:hypothetical protein